jgi:hypothetical protein
MDSADIIKESLHEILESGIVITAENTLLTKVNSSKLNLTILNRY